MTKPIEDSTNAAAFRTALDVPTVAELAAVEAAAQAAAEAAEAKYTKPSTGIPASDLAAAAQTSLSKADSAIQDLAGMTAKFNAGTAPEKAAFQASVSGGRNAWMPAGNRFGYPRTKSSSSTNCMNAVRWHKSPPTVKTKFVAVWSATSYTSGGGLAPVGNDIIVAAALMLDASAPGSAMAFKSAGAAQITVKNGGFVVSDPLFCHMPANAAYRVRSYVAPSGGTGIIPYGTSGLGAGNGGSLSFFGASANDSGAFSAAAPDGTQLSTAYSVNNANDSLYEPVVLCESDGVSPSWAILGDSRGYGAGEVGATGSGNITVSGAGDAAGNVGMWERAIASVPGHGHVNMSVSGSTLGNWAKNGVMNYAHQIADMACNRVVIALGTNDTELLTGAQIYSSLALLVERYRSLGFTKIVVPTLCPRTTSTDGWTTVENQSVMPTRQPAIDSANVLILGGISGATIIDLCGQVSTPDRQKWRTDLGFVPTTDGVHESKSMIEYMATLIAPYIT